MVNKRSFSAAPELEKTGRRAIAEAESRDRILRAAEALFSTKGFHHPGGSQAALLTGLAHLYNLIPYQRRALNAGRCGVEVEGGRVPTSDWMLNLQILTSGGYQCAPAAPHH